MEKLLFFPSIQTFDFDLISGSFLNVWALMSYFGVWFKTVLGSTHVVEKLLFFIVLQFRLNFGVFLLFGLLIGFF